MIMSWKQMLKWLSLIVLVIQNASTILLLRYVRTASRDLFFSTTAIVCQEIIKMIVSICLLYMESFSLRELTSTINQQIIKNQLDSIKTGIPALLYTLQTNLIYLAISNLDAAVFQVTSQIKILTTAILMVVMLKKSLRWLQWFSLFILCVGISVIQLQNVNVSKSAAADEHKNAFFGLICVVSACTLSGLAGVYFEKILKNSKVSIWVRNIQLGLFGTFFALVTAFISDGDNIREKGFFFGYNTIVWINILVQSAGGLLVAVVMKYADNILKGFATSIAIVVSCVASVFLFDTIIDYVFAFGTILVVLSVILYSYIPPPASQLLPTLNNSAASAHQSSTASLLSNSINSSSLDNNTNKSTTDQIQQQQHIPLLTGSTSTGNLLLLETNNESLSSMNNATTAAAAATSAMSSTTASTKSSSHNNNNNNSALLFHARSKSHGVFSENKQFDFTKR